MLLIDESGWVKKGNKSACVGLQYCGNVGKTANSQVACHHQVALNMMVGCFMLKEKLLNPDEMPILSARDIMDFLFFKFHKKMAEEQLPWQLKERHKKRQWNICVCC